jgi:hypothetical protein
MAENAAGDMGNRGGSGWLRNGGHLHNNHCLRGRQRFRDNGPLVMAMAAAATLSLVAANLEADQKARTLLLVSAVLFLGIAILSIFSIGVGFLIAGAMALLGAVQVPRTG